MIRTTKITRNGWAVKGLLILLGLGCAPVKADTVDLTFGVDTLLSAFATQTTGTASWGYFSLWAQPQASVPYTLLATTPRESASDAWTASVGQPVVSLDMGDPAKDYLHLYATATSNGGSLTGLAFN